MPTAAGYSGTPLAKKLGIVAGARVVPMHAPRDYRDWLAPLPVGVTFGRSVTASTDVVHVFASRSEALAQDLAVLRKTIRPDATVWVSWPKKASGVATDITEDGIRQVCLPMGFVDVKVCAVTDVWSGLKLVIRKELRPETPAR
ncbi:MAG TPA: DUF3052 domain-containing protein [Gemmatimonadaceae bacterium]|nr:DUF3052 domain-containing protein [Gemmatimonadaceae bacterium]